MTSDLQTQIFSIWLPLLIMVIFGVIGATRGVTREAIMAATIAIAAFVNSQWAYQWSSGLNQVYSGWPQQGEQFWISMFVLWATALIVGYGLGTLLPRQPLTPQYRL